MQATRAPWWADEDGQDLMEYAVLAGFLSVAAILVIRTIGPLIDALFATVVPALTP